MSGPAFASDLPAAAAQAVDGGEHADYPQSREFMEASHLGHAADEFLVVPVEVPEPMLLALSAFDLIGNTVPQ